MELDRLMSIIRTAVDAGIQEYRRSVEPEEDDISQAEAKRYLRRIGYKPSMLNKWKAAGLLTPAKTGDRQNSTVLYSFAEIKRLVCTIQMKTICGPQ